MNIQSIQSNTDKNYHEAYIGELGYYSEPETKGDKGVAISEVEGDLTTELDEFERILANSKNEYDHSQNLLYRYYAEVGKYPLLTADEELYYGSLARDGDQSAIHKMMQGNLRLVIMFAQRYENRGVELHDLISEGNLGLHHAIGKFEPERGLRFSTYSAWWIRYYLDTAVMNQGRTVRVPIHINKAIAKLNRAGRELMQSLKREATVAELSEATDMSIFEVMELMAHHKSSVSLDGMLTSDSNSDFYHIFADEEASNAVTNVVATDKQEILMQALESLDEKELEVISYRFGVNGKSQKTLDETGAEMDLTRDQVRYAQMKALTKMRDLLTARSIEIDDLLLL